MYNSQPAPQVSVSLVQILMTTVIVMVAFALPVYLIHQHRTGQQAGSAYTVSANRERQDESASAGRVAGASSEGDVLGAIIGEQLPNTSEAQLLTIGGGVMLTIAGLLFVYLVFTGRNKQPELEFEETTLDSF